MNAVQVTASAEVGLDAAARRRCARFVERVLWRRKLDGWELSVLLCDDRVIRELNRRYRGVDAATDVLSFSQREGPVAGATGATGEGRGRGAVPAGDVVVSIPTLRRNAAQRGIGASEELKRLLIHGILHLEGMDHEGREAQEAMIALQEQLVRELRRGTLL